MFSFLRRKKVAAATNIQQSGPQPQPNPVWLPGVLYGLSVTYQAGGAKVLISGQDSQLVEMMAAALRQDKRFLKLFRDSFRKANLPIK